ncbi:EAL domain-containing protein [Vibrio sp. D404a]|uniref:EAL domain-containing protein n=2 Tax=Vibrio TaxID=662 RepID=UPI002554AF5A|nr:MULTISPECIES: EAL domain-containing protein [unclassified Vibrio]MDK9736040.1 EAL domain-containing protein [Vibrio sp. D404a]MDK9797794.1 EAL domain-containing protein [Vibrio sp. D449a]
MDIETIPLSPITTSVIVIMIGIVVLATLYNARQSKKHNYALNRLEREKHKLEQAKFICEESNIPNIYYIQQKMANLEAKKGEVYYTAHVVCVGRNGDFYRYFDQQTSMNIKQKLHSQLSGDLKPSLIGLYDDRYIVMIFASEVSLNNKQQVEHQQQVRAALPNQMVINSKKMPFDYSVTTLHFSSTYDIAKPDRLFRRISYGILRAIQNQDGLYIHSEKDYQRNLRKRHMLQDLQRDIRDGGANFELAYQPIVHSMNHDRECIREVLLVWRKRGHIEPESYMSLLSDTPHIHYSLTLMIIRKVVELARKDEQGQWDYSINIAMSDLAMTSFYNDIFSLTKHCPEVRKKLIFELVEHSEAISQKHVQDNLQSLKRLGCRLAIDDFGTGYTNYDLLNKGLFDVVKIDGHFAMNMGKDPVSNEFLRFMFRLSEQVNFTLVVCGIEEELQAKYVPKKAHVCLQGLHFSHPKKLVNTLRVA